MAIIAGIFKDLFGVPIHGEPLQLTGRKNTSVTFICTNAATVTVDNGSYCMTVLPGIYAVCARTGFPPDDPGGIRRQRVSDHGRCYQRCTAGTTMAAVCCQRETGSER
ncbi:prophage tail fiber N-terminal domain-containing protein [Klebsiella aerogenes]|uniref:prophage tail fiber N-terminal domain-containing protein n=1 Tax=Klebsiella aerogenes TaxID=548 RepID=UPI00387E7F65